jgi:(2R)-3-sulfolactate dehydrogenase (NADP+)
MMARLTIARPPRALVRRAAGAPAPAPAMAAATARALVLAEAQGLGLARPEPRGCSTATHLRNGRVERRPWPRVARRKGGALLVDAGEGLAFPACELAVAEAIATARELGVPLPACANSHHAACWSTTCGRWPRPAWWAGLRQLAGGDAGGRRPAPDLRHQPGGGGLPAPRRRPADDRPVLSEVARGKLMVAAKEGRPIPPGWALDAEGAPTTDPQAA